MALSAEHTEKLLSLLKMRFEKNKPRHASIQWETVEAKLEANPK
ncbi:MAG: DUF4256 domain-containing protein, partial [Mangrovimonas sp.]|nr:DUF4256 domain-containing protein [Mangrovimonas sp.]